MLATAPPLPVFCPGISPASLSSVGSLASASVVVTFVTSASTIVIRLSEVLTTSKVIAKSLYFCNVLYSFCNVIPKQHGGNGGTLVTETAVFRIELRSEGLPPTERQLIIRVTCQGKALQGQIKQLSQVRESSCFLV